MANIGQFKVNSVWTKAEDIAGYTFVATESYTIQNKGYEPLMLCESVDTPEDDKVGFIVNTGDKVGYTCKNGEYLFMKAYQGETSFNIAEGI